MYLNPNENNIVYPMDNRLNNFNTVEQTQNNFYSEYITSNYINQIDNGNNLIQNNNQTNIFPQTTNQIKYTNQINYQNQLNNNTNINENVISYTLNNNNNLNYTQNDNGIYNIYNINNAQNDNGMNNINQYNLNNYYNQSNQINQNNIIVKNEEEEKTKPLDSNRNKIKQRTNEYNKLIPINKVKNNKNKSKVNKLKLNEEILLKNQKQSLNKDLDVKTHFDIEVTKEQYVFPYKKVLKIAIPLLSHYEMPVGYTYKSPLLSPDGQYLSCIASLSSIDVVYVWSIDDLYWFKFKFSMVKSKVDYVAFTPDSKFILIQIRNLF